MTVAELPQVIIPNPLFRKVIETLSGIRVSACFQCEKCTNGCPMTFAMDIMPHKLIRSVHLGLKDETLKSDTIWVCASCETCTARCPNGIDIAHIMDTLRQMALREKVKIDQKKVPQLHSAFLSSVKRFGRIYELGMTLDYKLATRNYTDDIKLGLDMFKKGKLKLIPGKIRADSAVKDIFRKADKGARR